MKNINDLTIGEARDEMTRCKDRYNDLAKLFNEDGLANPASSDESLIGEYVIIRTYSAGVWAGILSKRNGAEVVLTEARRMWSWKAKKSISLSGVAVYGIDQSDSRICPPVKSVDLDRIEIIELSDIAKESIRNAPDAEQG